MNQSTKTYLALGDSYTIGEGVPVQESFPFQTAAILRQAGIHIADPDIIAVTGWTTGDLLRAIEKANMDKRYGLVSLLIGVNNQYQHRSLIEYENEFILLMRKAILFTDNRPGRVFVLSIPDYSITPFAGSLNPAAIHQELEEFNLVNRKLAGEFEVHYIEITEESRKALDDPALLASDGLHYSGKEYARWAKLLADAVLKTVR